MESYAKGPREELIRKPIGEVFLQTVRTFGDQLAVVSRHQNIRWNWEHYGREALRTAAGLCALGLVPGDRVGVWATNCAEWTLLQFGCALAGLVLVNINPAYRTHEMAFVLKKSRIKALFLHEQDRRANYREILQQSLPVEGATLEHVIYLDTPAWTAFLREPHSSTVCPRINEEDAANIQFTSGTTGMPKGVVLTHLNLVNNARFIGQYMQLSAEDRICVPVPLFHCFGCVIGTMTAVVVGAAVIFPSPVFEARATLEAIRDEQATAIYGVPAMFIKELQEYENSGFNLGSLRTGLMSGAPCPVEIMRRVMVQMHCPEILVCYGQTESAPVITMSRVNDDVEVRSSTVGCPLPETEVRIASLETGITLPVGEQGELLARGYMVMKEYDGDAAATSQTVDADGWLHTGDLAVMRPDGYFRITGRARDMIIRGGENVYPREVEEFLYTHPKISDVHVIGIPDERLGETVIAWIRLRNEQSADESEIQTFCKGQLAYYKIPQYIRFVDDFPMTLSGKIQKYKMRQFEIERRGLSAIAKQQTA